MIGAPLARHAAVLGVSLCASRAEVAAAFRAAALRSHPDRGGCPTTFAAVRTARDVLMSEIDAYGRIRGEPASLRMYRNRGSGSRRNGNWALVSAVLIPFTVGVFLSVRLLYADVNKQRSSTSARAGGSSRLFPTLDHAYVSDDLYLRREVSAETSANSNIARKGARAVRNTSQE